MGSKHNRDRALDFQGFLNELQDWELSLHDKDKKMKPQASEKENLKGRPVESSRMASASSSSGQFDYLKKFDAISSLSSNLMTEESVPDATSEKELGNEYFKQKKFKEAIDCYSRSIALSPTAVAYANRAMAYLKIKKFQEAEDDCTEALNLDDRYIKAYSRRVTARKELGKYRKAIEDAEFALRLEPDNQEIKKQRAEVKSLYDKEIIQKASGVLSSSLQEAPKRGKLETEVNEPRIETVSDSIERTKVTAFQDKKHEKLSASVAETEERNLRDRNGNESQDMNGSPQHVESAKRNKTGKNELKASVQELASKAAMRARSEAAKRISPPSTAYQFEISWKALSGDRTLQAHLLKVTPPSSLPQIFKNALSTTMLVDIIKCIATIFREEMDLSVKYLENLTKIPRFDMLIMFLSSADKADLLRVWDEVFCNTAAPMEYSEILDNLRALYCLKQ